MNWRRAPQDREQRVASPAESFIGLWGYAKQLELAARTLVDYFTPRSADDIKDGHRTRSRMAWRARRHASDRERMRRRRRQIARAARRITARRHPKSGRAA